MVVVADPEVHGLLKGAIAHHGLCCSVVVASLEDAGEIRSGGLVRDASIESSEESLDAPLEPGPGAR